MPFTAAALNLGSSIVKTATQIWAGPFAGAADSLVAFTERAVTDRLEQRRLARFFDECVDTVATNLVKLIRQGSAQLPDDELEAIVLAVQETIDVSLASELAIVAADLDARVLERATRTGQEAVLAKAALSEKGETFYRLLLREACAYMVETVTTLPSYQDGVFAELLRRTTSIVEVLDRVIERLPARQAVDDFDADYRRLVANKLDRLELFGAPTSVESTRRYPLSAAYISLGAVTASNATPSLASEDINDAVQDWLVAGDSTTPRLFVPLAAGSGKSALLTSYLSWYTSEHLLRSARRGYDFDLDVIDLRDPSPVAGEIPVESVLDQHQRLMLIGDAGSGKTTLLHWLAVRCSRADFDNQLSQWNGLIPFFIPLRRFAEAPLPTPAEFASVIGPHIAEEMPQGWAHEHLRNGRALVLIDGIDELQEGHARIAARQWLEELVTTFPKSRYIVTSRPAAAKDEWENWNQFSIAELKPMPLPKIRLFIQRWHEAIRGEITDHKARARLDGDQVSLLTLIESDRHLRALCVNPLLCALLCALNRERRRHLPRNRMGVYRAALEMLLDLRDRERQVYDTSSLDLDKKVIILQDLALYLVRNGWADAPVDRVIEQISRSLRSLQGVTDTAETVLRILLERSGLLRMPTVDRVDFLHRTFQEYLAAKAAIEHDEVGFLINKALDDQYRDVIIMGVGHSHPRQRSELLTGLIAQVDQPETDRAASQRLELMIVACLQNAAQLDPDLRKRIEALASGLLPPESVDLAPDLAAAGEVVLDLLAERPPQTAAQAAASVRVATLIGGHDAMTTIASIAKQHSGLEDELARAWNSFDPESYAREVLAHATDTSADSSGKRLTVTDTTFLPFLHHLAWLEELTISAWSFASLRDLPDNLPALRRLCIAVSELRDLDGVSVLKPLTHFDFTLARGTMKLKPLTELENLVALRMRCNDAGTLDLAPLAKLKNLRMLQIGQPNARFIELHPLSKMTDLTVFVPENVVTRGREALGARSVLHHAQEFPAL